MVQQKWLSYSKFSKPGFNNRGTVNFQMFKLDIEKAEEPEIKLPTTTGLSKKQENSRVTSTSPLLTTPKPLTMWITTNGGTFLKRWEHQTTWTASWEICMQIKKQRLEPDMENKLVQIGKGVHQGCILSPCLFNLCAEYIMRNAGLEEAQVGIKITRRNINNLRYADDVTLMTNWGGTKEPLDESERRQWKKLA